MRVIRWRACPKGGVRVLPAAYRAVGQPGGLLLALRLDEVRVGSGKSDCRLAAISPERVAGGRYDGLIGV